VRDAECSVEPAGLRRESCRGPQTGFGDIVTSHVPQADFLGVSAARIYGLRGFAARYALEVVDGQLFSSDFNANLLGATLLCLPQLPASQVRPQLSDLALQAFHARELPAYEGQLLLQAIQLLVDRVILIGASRRRRWANYVLKFF